MKYGEEDCFRGKWHILRSSTPIHSSFQLCSEPMVEMIQLSRRTIRIRIYTVVLFSELANALILPLVPYLSNNLNADAFQYGLVFTVYYVAQLISEFGCWEWVEGSFTFGKISDMYGRKVAVTMSLFGLAFCHCIFLPFTPSYVLPTVHQERLAVRRVSCACRAVWCANPLVPSVSISLRSYR